jgi:phosphate transport system protein
MKAPPPADSNATRKRHTDREYEAQLDSLRERLLRMAGLVEAMIAAAVKSFAERDVTLAHETISQDAKVNSAEVTVDELCLRILATRQPMASDLRFITLALKMVTDLERIGDLAVNICERAIDMAAVPRARSYEDMHRMAKLVQGMVHDAIEAFIEGDADKAAEVIQRDDEVDRLYEAVFQQILDAMRDDPDAVHRGIHYQSVAKWLERAADHVTNIAEQVIFMVRGEDVRHPGKLV